MAQSIYYVAVHGSGPSFRQARAILIAGTHLRLKEVRGCYRVLTEGNRPGRRCSGSSRGGQQT
jgi:hypothetical protein